MSTESDAADNVLKMIELYKSTIETLTKLEKALRIAALHPGIFKEGAINVRTSPRTAYRGFGKPDLRGLDYIVVDATGREFTTPIKDVPRALWPADLREAVEKYEHRAALREQRKNRTNF